MGKWTISLRVYLAIDFPVNIILFNFELFYMNFEFEFGNEET